MIARRGLAAAVAALLWTSGAVIATPVDERAVADGMSLYDRGRFDEARTLLAPAAEAGSAAAQYHLAMMAARGEGEPKDLAAAARWFMQAADQGHAHSQYILGHMFARGEGVERDVRRAHMWFSAAAASGWWKAREARERLVDAGMSPAEVAEASRLYADWRRERDAPSR